VLPAIGGTVLIPVGDTSWISVGKNLFISDGSKQANFIVTAINAATSFTGRFLGLNGDSASGTVASGALVVPGTGDQTAAWDLDALTALTDNSTGIKSDTISIAAPRSLVIIPIQLTDFVNATTLKIAIPYAFGVASVLYRVSKAGTGAGASVTLQTQVNGVAATGGAMTLTLANAATVGGTVAGTVFTGGNAGSAGQTLELAVTVGTVFTAGDGWFEFVVANADLAATIAAFAFKLNQLRTALRHQ
jgi:hypothetical protein